MTAKRLPTLAAQIVNHRVLTRALCAVVIEKDKYLKVVRQASPFVLANVFRAQLHLPCFYVVSLLNEPCVEHDSTESSLRKAFVLEKNLDVAAEFALLGLLI